MKTLNLPGVNAKRLIERDSKVISPSYPRGYPFVMDHGKGVYVWDVDDNKFLDFAAGIAVNSTGHSHPKVLKAIQEQAEKFIHISSDFYHAKWIELAEYLDQIAPFQEDAVSFVTNSGTESVETALKLARYHTGRSQFIGFLGGFHGRTFGSVTLTASKPHYHRGFFPLMNGVTHIPYPDPYRPGLQELPGENVGDASLRYLKEEVFGRIIPADEVAAIIIEPIQGEGGVRVPDPQSLAGLRALWARHGWLLMLDEIQTGSGRTGSFFHYQQHGLLPDVATLAKGLGNGMPIGACLARGAAAELLGPGKHGSTFGGNPVACAAGLATLRVLGVTGTRLRSEFRSAMAGCASVRDIRGSGLMIGIELDRPCAELVQHALDRGLLINVTADSVIRLLPPLILGDAEAELLVATLAPLIRAF